ncbi:MAG: hypothetical protein WD696_10805 [Bryobacteraceae bacterium]
MYTGRAFTAGVISGLVMVIAVALARLVGVPIDPSMILGTMLGLTPGAGTWIIGFILFLIGSGVIGLLYGLGFEYVTHRSGAPIGIMFSLIHIVIGGLFFGALPSLHPLMPEVVPPTGAFFSNYGNIGVLLFVLGHLIFGAVVGLLYKPVLHTRPYHVHA